MNKDNILLLADTIENSAIPGLGFNMFSFLTWTQHPAEMDKSGHNCGTIACIGGWANALRLKYEPTPAMHLGDMSRMHDWAGAREWLGLGAEIGDQLFAPASVNFAKITPQIAASVLRNLANTGELVWPDEIKDFFTPIGWDNVEGEVCHAESEEA